MTPSFILAGAQRCGTTSLFRALMEHPVILSLYHKGVNYFDLNYDKGWSWYQGHFPVRAFAAVRTRHNGDVPVTFEASGYYMYHPHAAARLAHDLPQVKVLVMLRDPIERAYSAYRHEFARASRRSRSSGHWSWRTHASSPSSSECLLIPAITASATATTRIAAVVNMRSSCIG